MFEYITFALSVLATILHFVKGKTSTKIDDKASDIVDEAEKVLPVLEPMLEDTVAPAQPVKVNPANLARAVNLKPEMK